MYDEYKKGIDCWRERHADDTSAVATLAIVSDKMALPIGNTACHAGLNSTYAQGISGKRQYIVSGLQTTQLSEADRQLFVEWLIQRSPFASAFPIKDAAWLIEQRCLVGTADVPANVLGAGMIASRFQSERKNVKFVQLMMDMVKAGVDESLAFLVCHYIRVGDRVSFSNGDSCHSALAYNISKGDVLNYLKHNLVNPTKHTYSENTNYQGVFKLFGGETKPSFPDWLKKNFTVEKKKAAPKAQSKNPFLKAKVEKSVDHEGPSFDREEFIKAMVAFQHVIFAEVGYDQGIHHQQQLAI